MAKQSAIDKRILELLAEIKERENAIEVLRSVDVRRVMVKEPTRKRAKLKKVEKPSEAAS